MVAETIVDGFPDGQFDELVATIRSQESETLARHTVGSLTEAIAHARNDRSRRDAIRVNQANELRRVAAIFATTTDTATELPIDALKAARDVLDQGGVVEAHDLLGLSAAADVADRTLAQAIAIINQQQTLSAILGYLSERGYEPQPLASAVTVENGVLVTREEWPDHALHVAVDSKARIREVRTRLAAPGADAHAADLAVENQMCADLVELRDDLKQRGVALDLTIANAEIVALPGARQPEERLIVDTARTQHDASGASA
jgi:hypothetical protein